MRIVVLLIFSFIGFGIGWYTRGLASPAATGRVASTPRKAALPPTEPERATPPIEEREPIVRGESVDPPHEVTETTPAADASAEPEEEPFKAMIRAQKPQMRAWASMQARQKLEGALKDLGYDAATTKRILDLLVQEAENATELAYDMFLGEAELDPDAFLWLMGVGNKLSADTEAQLASFLGDSGTQAVRAKLEEVHAKQADDLAEMSINMMSIPDLSPEQRVQLKEVFGAQNMMQEQWTQFADIMGDREKMNRLMAGEGLTEEIEKSAAPRRERMRQILNDAQLERYVAWEKQMVQQAELGIKMMSGLMNPKPKAQEDK